MHFQTRTICHRLALLTLSISLAAAQTTRPEVPYVPTTDEAVQPMLKLADVKKTDVVYEPVPMITSVTNAATFAAGPVAPGSLATIFGSNFAGQKVSVTFNDLPATVLFSNNTQINFEVPPELASQTNALVFVTVDGRASVALNVQLASFAPGIFKGGVLNQDNVVNSATAPEAPGSILQILATGLSGLGTFSVQLAGQTITNLPYAGPAPGLNGVQQINVMVPLNLLPMTTSIAVCGTPEGGGATICSPAVPLVIANPNRSGRQSPFYWGTNAVLYDAQDVDLIGSLGNPGKVGARITYYWSDIEPTPGNWQFTVYDGLVKRAASGQIPLLGILAYAMKRVAGAAASMQGDPWALSFCPPDDVEDFVTFAAKVVARYPAVLYWEIWNEPNTANFWRPSPDPIRYVELLKRSYAAIKAANPKAVVVLGGLSPGTGSGQVNTMSAASFLEAVYQNGGKNYFDAVGFHPYNGSLSPDLYLADYVNSVHDVMKQYEDGNKEIWVTEMGWFVGTEGDALSEAGQADYLSRAFTILYNLEFVERVYWYNLKDYANQAPVSQPPPSVCGPIAGTPVDYGLFRVDGSARPAADAFKKTIQ